MTCDFELKERHLCGTLSYGVENVNFLWAAMVYFNIFESLIAKTSVWKIQLINMAMKTTTMSQILRGKRENVYYCNSMWRGVVADSPVTK